MDAHPGSCLRTFRPCMCAQGLLSIHPCGNGIADSREGEKARVTCAVDFLAAVARCGGSQDLPVARKQLRVLIAELLQEACGSFDVGERKVTVPAGSFTLGLRSWL